MNIKLPDKYRERREYPAIEEQLDYLWHGMNSDESKRVEPFYSLIKGVKDANPKPK